MAETQNPETSLSPLYVLLGGLSLGLSFLPLPLFGLAWVALVPLLLLWDRATSVPRFLAEIYTAFLIAYALAFFWPMLHVFSEAIYLAFGGLLVIPLLWTLPFAAALPYRQRWGRLPGALVLATLYLAVETVFSQGVFDFPWPVLGLTQADALPVIQFAEFTGVTGLSLWVLVLNGLVFAVMIAKRPKRRLTLIVAMVGLMALSALFGQWRRHQLSETTRVVTVGLVQPAVDSYTWVERYGSSRMVHLSALSDSLIAAMNAPPVFVIWPEMALPPSPNRARQEFVDDELQAWTERRQVALLTGALLPEGEPGQTNRYVNGAVLYRPKNTAQQYRQMRFPPMLSGVPLVEQAPWLSRRGPAQFVPGVAQEPLVFDDLRIGVMIGFEMLLGDHARHYSRQNADFLVALTRDGAWGSTPGFGFDLSHPRLRAIESRRSVAQVTATGGTALLAPDGAVIYESNPNVPSAHLAAVPLYQGATLYAVAGNWLGGAALVASFFLVAWITLVGLWRAIRTQEELPPRPHPVHS